jgi:hypothetical protein
MASFLINTPNQEVFGTEENDVFLIQTALNSNVQGLGGNDLITGSANNYIATTLQGGQGNDTLNISGRGDAIGSFFAGGGGDDRISADDLSAIQDTTINGGGGNDTIIFSAGLTFGTGSRVNGNAGNDFISGDASSFNNALIAGGGGNDTIFLSASESSQFATIAGGGGADLISGQFNSATGLWIEGDTIGDSEFFGNDTIIFTADQDLEQSYIGGGGGADRIIVEVGASASGFTIGGGNGRDTISVFTDSASAGRVNGGAASDVIFYSGSAGTSVSIFGGGGNDTIQVDSGFSAVIVGGEGADKFDLQFASAAYLRYNEAADASTLAQLDFASAATNSALFSTETAFEISQDFVQAITGEGSNANFSTNTRGVVTFTPGFEANLTARVTELDTVLTQGSVVSFEDGSRTYIFIQAGATDSGIEGDVVIRTDKLAERFFISGGTAIAVEY